MRYAKPAPGMWFAFCCVHDLHVLTDDDDMDDIAESIDECGGRLWPTLESALADLGPFTDPGDISIAEQLRQQCKAGG